MRSAIFTALATALILASGSSGLGLSDLLPILGPILSGGLPLPPLPALPIPSLDQIPIIGGLYVFLAAGIPIKLPVGPNGTTLSIGAVSVPLDLLCDQVPHTTCRLCFIDCIVAHNASYGYGCGGMPGNAPGNKCYCEYNKTLPVPSMDAMCGNHEANAAGLPLVNTLLDQVLVTVLRTRYQTVLCNPVIAANASCQVECPHNHAATSGYCANYNASDTSLVGGGYCICSYANQTLPGYAGAGTG